MSWFNTDALKVDLTGGSEMFKGWVTDNNLISKETFEKLTLTTPELKEERERMDQEEKRKERVKDMLAGMFPWETRDPERDILVEECKDAILQLSEDKATFFGPYAVPRTRVKLDADKKSTDPENNNTASGQEYKDDGTEAEGEDTGSSLPSTEQLEKLKNLSPLPLLLQDFEIETHVGLIQKMLKEDKQLSKLHSKFGVGEAEHSFWRNYFFHCAYCRYEAGLSIDEIWSENQQVQEITPGEKEEETIMFNHPSEDKTKQSMEDKAFPSEPTTDVDAPFSKETSHSQSHVENDGSIESNSLQVSTDYEMVGGDGSELDLGDGLDDSDPGVDYELDELEAEIARELED